MTATCPVGHTSTTDDYCDQCGAKIEPATQLIPAATGDPGAGAAAGIAAGLPPDGTEACPACGAANPAGNRFCETCGERMSAPPVPPGDFEAILHPPQAPPAGEVDPSAPTASASGPTAAPGASEPATPPPPAGAPAWEAVATADRAYYERVAPEGVAFPPHCPDRTFALVGGEVRIGRRSASRGIAPEIDLSGRPEDTGISHLHAILILQDDGSYSLIDPGSTNGTTVNDDPRPVDHDVPVPLKDGDSFHVGAWTTITLRARPTPTS